MNYDVIILGAGIVGCACARECTLAGLRTAVVERDFPAGGATAAGMGHIVVMAGSPAQLALTQYARSLWQGLQAELPPAVEYDARGTLWIAATPEELDEVLAKHATYSAAHVVSSTLDSRQVAEAEPALRPGLAGGLLIPEDVVIYPPAAASFFLHQATELGAVLLRGEPATAVASGSVCLADGTDLLCATVIVATGTDSSVLPWLPLRKRKGHLVITDRYPERIHHQLLELGYLKSAHQSEGDSVAFNLQPRRTGQLLIGASRQYADEPEIDYAILGKMLERARSYVPSIAKASAIRAWAGFRAATPDNLPLLGPAGDPAIQLAVGFEGLGITSAPAAARLLIDGILHRTPEIPLEPYLPTRATLAGEHDAARNPRNL